MTSAPDQPFESGVSRTRDPDQSAAAAWTLYLASRSPRRRQLLEQHGVAHVALAPAIDDTPLTPKKGCCPHAWAGALAYLKAAAAARLNPDLAADASAVIAGADTVVVRSGTIFSAPRDRADARAMLNLLNGGEHGVITGVALVHPRSGRREIFTESAKVRVGRIEAAELDRYADSGEWRGKAGAYNLAERLSAGWPITYDGDPATIMGLPVMRLLTRLGGLLH